MINLNRTVYYGNYKEDKTCLTHSDFNEIIPVCVKFLPRYIEREETKELDIESNETNNFYYFKPSTRVSFKVSNTLKKIKEGFFMSNGFYEITITNKKYFFIKGLMLDSESNILMLLGLKKNNRLRINLLGEFDANSYKDLVLYYSTRFFTDPTLSALNRRLQKDILTYCYEKGIEVRVITSSEIEKNTFADVYEFPKANSISQLENYMSEVLPNFLNSEEDNFTFEELRSPVLEYPITSEEALLPDTLEVEYEEDTFAVTFTATNPLSEEELEELESLRREANAMLGISETQHSEFEEDVEFEEVMEEEDGFSMRGTVNFIPPVPVNPALTVEEREEVLAHTGTIAGIWHQIRELPSLIEAERAARREIELIDDTE